VCISRWESLRTCTQEVSASYWRLFLHALGFIPTHLPTRCTSSEPDIAVPHSRTSSPGSRCSWCCHLPNMESGGTRPPAGRICCCRITPTRQWIRLHTKVLVPRWITRDLTQCRRDKWLVWEAKNTRSACKRLLWSPLTFSRVLWSTEKCRHTLEPVSLKSCDRQHWRDEDDEERRMPVP
jgi:hypothetical protein